MKHTLASVTQTVKALPVLQERAKMPPARVRSQVRSSIIALLAFAIGGGLLAFTAAPWYAGTAFGVFGLYALDARLVKDFLAGTAQFRAALRNGAPEAP